MIECDDILELAALVPDKKFVAASLKEAKKTIGTRGATVAQVQHAATTIKERLLMRNKTILAALKLVDEDGSGFLSREEVKKMLHTYYLIKYTDFYTGEVRGELDEFVVDTLMDFVDQSGDGQVDYHEFTKVLISDDIMSGGASPHISADLRTAPHSSPQLPLFSPCLALSRLVLAAQGPPRRPLRSLGTRQARRLHTVPRAHGAPTPPQPTMPPCEGAADDLVSVLMRACDVMCVLAAVATSRGTGCAEGRVRDGGRGRACAGGRVTRVWPWPVSEREPTQLSTRPSGGRERRVLSGLRCRVSETSRVRHAGGLRARRGAAPAPRTAD